MMPHENLVGAVYLSSDAWSCPDGKNCAHDYSCKECAERLVKEYETSLLADERTKFVKWCQTKGYGGYVARMLIEQYEKEQKGETGSGSRCGSGRGRDIGHGDGDGIGSGYEDGI